MPLAVRASVVDIQGDTPKPEDQFIVDTNVWLFLLYSPASLNSSGAPLPQATHYPAYIQRAVASKSVLRSVALTLAEIAHNVERAEREAYVAMAGKNIQTKDFRHDYPNQRHKVTTLVKDTWADVMSFSKLLEMNLDAPFVESAMTLFPSVGLDGYDVFMAEKAIQSGSKQIITDDKDFLTVPGLTVFTANANAIQTAQAAGKLITR